MFRYYLVKTADLPKLGDHYGHFHYIDLGSLGAAGAGWNALVLQETNIDPNPNWTALPRIADAKTTINGALSAVNGLLPSGLGAGPLGVVGLSGAETMLGASDKLGAIFRPLLHP